MSYNFIFVELITAKKKAKIVGLNFLKFNNYIQLSKKLYWMKNKPKNKLNISRQMNN